MTARDLLRLRESNDAMRRALEELIAADTFCACSGWDVASRLRYAKAIEQAMEALSKAKEKP